MYVCIYIDIKFFNQLYDDDEQTGLYIPGIHIPDMVSDLLMKKKFIMNMNKEQEKKRLKINSNRKETGKTIPLFQSLYGIKLPIADTHTNTFIH